MNSSLFESYVEEVSIKVISYDTNRKLSRSVVTIKGKIVSLETKEKHKRKRKYKMLISLRNVWTFLSLKFK